MVECPKCGYSNEENVANCTNCHINLKWAFENPDQFLGEVEARKVKQELEERVSTLIMTTTYAIEGKAIESYLGVLTSEVVLGTGLLSELDGGIADFLGTRAGAFQSKLRQAKEEALRELTYQAASRGADAVVGLDIDYSTLTSNLLMVVATGTGVKLSAVRQVHGDRA